ncbi:MAG TPA: AAA family ATPase [Jatrophihabitans sp.]
MGRQEELGVLQRTLAEARTTASRTVLVLGDPGIGKTSLVGSFLAANPKAARVWVSGAADETTVRLGVVDQIRRAAGRAPPEPTADPTAAGAELVDIVDQAVPAILVIDDLHWVDPDSRKALLYLLRRLPSRGALVVCTAHPDVEHLLGRAWARLFTAPERARRLHLSGLDAVDVRQLAGHRGNRLGRPAARRLRDHTDGNPLHVTALLDEVTEAALNDASGSLPAPRSYAARVLARVAVLSPEARTLVAATSVLGSRAPLRAVLATAGSGVSASALDEVVAHRLLTDEIRAGVRELSFPRVLTRAAVYHGLSPSQRCELHRAAARNTAGVRLHPCPFAGTCSDDAARCALADEPDDDGDAGRLQQLTAREQTVVDLIRRGLTNREIAATLFVSTKTIEYHVHNVFEKLGLHTRRELWWLSDHDGPTYSREVVQTRTNGAAQPAD